MVKKILTLFNSLEKSQKIFLLLFIILCLYFCIGMIPFVQFESDAIGIANGCERIINTGNFAENEFSYSYHMQSGTYFFITLLQRLTGLNAFICYSILSAFFSIVFYIFATIFLSRFIGISVPIAGLILLFFQEIYSIGYYTNSTVIAGAFFIVAFLFLYTIRKNYIIPISGLLMALAMWSRVDVLFIFPVSFLLIYKGKFIKALIKSLVLGAITVSCGLFLMYLSNANISGFLWYHDALYGTFFKASGNLGIFDIFVVRTHIAFFSILLVVFIVIGLIRIIRDKKWILIAAFFVSIMFHYIFRWNNAPASKHLFYYIPFLALPLAYIVKNFHLFKKKSKIFLVSVFLITFASQYIIGIQVFFKSMPWMRYEYALTRPSPTIINFFESDLKKYGIEKFRVVLGGGTKLPTSDEIMLTSGILFSPLMWNNMKSRLKKSFKILTDFIKKYPDDKVYISVSQSSSPYVFNVLFNSGYDWIEDEINYKKTTQIFRFLKDKKLIIIFKSKFERNYKSFEDNFSKIRSSRNIHVSTWDWENYILRQNAKNYYVICDIAYLIKKDEELK